MKRIIYLAITCALATCCSLKENIGADRGVIALSQLDFDISVENADFTKAAKTAWSVGDKINIWFDNHYAEASPDLIISYNGSKWSKSYAREGCLLSQSGTLAALFESGNNLDAFTQTTEASTTTYSIPAADIEGFNFGCTPMVTRATGVSYEVNTSTKVLESSISGWQFATRFKVLIPTDANMSRNANNYALCISKVCHPLKSFATKKNSGADRVDFSITSDLMSRYSGGVQESDGIAFYFDNLSCCDEAITFALLESGANISKTYTTPDKKTLDATTDTKCAGVKILYSYFTEGSFSGGGGETPVNKDDLNKFQIVYQLTDLEDSVTLRLANDLAAKIGAAKGETPAVVETSAQAHIDEIIIGRTTRSLSQNYYSNKDDDFEWKINYTKGDVVITAGGSWALEYAVNKFTEDYLDPNFVYTDGKVEKGTVRGQQLFPMTEGCNLRILDQNVWVREDDTNTGFWEDNGESCAISVRKRRLAQVVCSCMPDIITFQEYGNGLNRALKDSLKKYSYVTNLRVSGDYTPIFYNSNTIEYEGKKWHKKFPEFTASDGSVKTPDAMKSYTAALFKHKATGKDFLVVSTHIYTPLADKYDHECKTSEISTIKDLVDEILKTYNVPVILAGDMNCQRASNAMQLLEQSGYKHVVDIATVSGDGSNGWHVCSAEKYMREYDPSMKGHYMGWTHDKNQGATRCVDQMYLYNYEGVEVKVFERMHAWFTVLLSDHYPNYADIAL